MCVLAILVSGCSQNLTVCGDGTCTIDEDAMNNCPEDCDRTVDLIVKDIDFEDRPMAWATTEFEVTIVNRGYVPSKHIGKVSIFKEGRHWVSWTVDPHDHDVPETIDVDEGVDLEVNDITNQLNKKHI